MKNRKTGKLLCLILLAVCILGAAADLINLALTPKEPQLSFTPGNGGGFATVEGGTLLLPEGEGFAHSGESGGTLSIPGHAGTGKRTGGRSLAAVARNWWIPILAVCLIGGGVCLTVWLNLRKKEKEEIAAACGSDSEENGETREFARRKRHFLIPVLCVLLAVAAVIAMLPAPETENSAITVRSQVLSETPEAADISTVLTGAGTLEAQSVTTVTLPGQVKVTGYFVRNDDIVSEGDPLASVDKTTAAYAMVELQTLLEELDKDLETERKQKAPETVTATAAGRVKRIYAQKGDSASEVLQEHGALMLLSLDGLMEVRLSTEGTLTQGESVSVTLSDGTVLEGKIFSARDGEATVTVSDEIAPCGDAVTVTDDQGRVLGSGELNVHSGLRVIGYSGTISGVSVAENQKVRIGDRLLTLEDTGATAEYRTLLIRRQELEAQMAQLAQLAQTGIVYAQEAGQVSGVPQDAQFCQLSASGTDYQLLMLAQIDEPEGDEEEPPEGEVRNGYYAAAFVSAEEGMLQVMLYPEPVELPEDYDLSALWQLEKEELALCPYSGSIQLLQDGALAETDVTQLQVGDLLVLYFNDGTLTDVLAQHEQDDSAEEPSHRPGSGQGGMGLSSGGGQNVTTPGYETYRLTHTPLLTITGQETAQVTIQVDELDILALTVGLNAQITLDAMKGRAFTGVVTQIGITGVNDGGNTKFPVTVAFPREAQMLEGMNVSVRIVTHTERAAATLPAAALVEEGGKTYVYTTYDEKQDLLGGLVEVQTGISDGERVEILSGVDTRMQCYYRYADTVTYSFLKKTN